MKQAATYIYGIAFVLIGISHFTHPQIFVPIVPEMIGFPVFWVYLSGVFEIALGVGVCFEKTRKVSSILIILMLLVLYTANLNMWWNDIPFNGTRMSTIGHVVRFFVQLGLIVCALWFGSMWKWNRALK